MNPSHYDIVILGAGPAGLACALELKNTTYSVLLIEKNAEIGPKACAGGLTGLANDYKIPLDKTRSFSEQIIEIKDTSYTVELVNPIRTITRAALGEFQIQQIRDAQNITLLTNTTVKEINQQELITVDGRCIQFNYLVGADGSNSMVRKSLGLQTKQCIGLYYELPVITNKCTWYLNYKLLKTGYIWIFPHQEFTNIGVYFDPAVLPSKKAREVLEDYITRLGYSFNTKEIMGGPVAYNYQGYAFGNTYLIGDAAGLTSKASGEGISYALVSGKEIARKIMDSSYKTAALNNMIRIKRFQDGMFKLVETFPFLHAFWYRRLIELFRIKAFQGFFGI